MELGELSVAMDVSSTVAPQAPMASHQKPPCNRSRGELDRLLEKHAGDPVTFACFFRRDGSDTEEGAGSVIVCRSCGAAVGAHGDGNDNREAAPAPVALVVGTLHCSPDDDDDDDDDDVGLNGIHRPEPTIVRMDDLEADAGCVDMPFVAAVVACLVSFGGLLLFVVAPSPGWTLCGFGIFTGALGLGFAAIILRQRKLLL